MGVEDPPVEIRVHGVGGPQGRKMLGMLDEDDIVTVPPFGHRLGPDRTIDIPVNTESRFVRRVPDDGTEAYEWGGLTTGSWAKALWILYLPFTLLNAAGWAHHAARPDTKAPVTVRLHLAAARFVAALGTVTYVLWMGYITLDLVAVRWRDHVLGEGEVAGLARGFVHGWIPYVAPAAYLGLVAALGLASVRRSRFEEVGGDDESAWPPVPDITDRAFFSRAGRHRLLLEGHSVLGAVVALAVVVGFVREVDRTGLALMIVATAQAVALVVLALVEMAGRLRHRPERLFDPFEYPPPGARRAWPWIPAGAVFAAVGTAIAHSAFAGTARLLRPVLASFPDRDPADVLPVRAELGAADVLGWAVAGAAVVVIVMTIWHAVRRSTPTSVESGLAVRLARRAQYLGLVLLLAIAVPAGVYMVLNLRAADLGSGNSWTQFVAWYDQYDFDPDSLFQRLGAAVLVALPGTVFLVLRGAHESGAARIVGNVWDVLTFWPRRFHPFAAPPSAERSVPELRARVEHVLSRRASVVLVAHSQGSVIAAAALATAAIDGDRKPSLVTFGSPLATLYTPTWPAYIPRLVGAVPAAVDTGEPWVNFWRATDPIGAGVPCATNEQAPDPQQPTPAELEDAVNRVPLERPRPWGTVAGHSYYLVDAAVRKAIAARRS